MDPEEVSGTTMRYIKTVFQLEKGLPPNSVVPKLKQKVESMKDKVCTVSGGHCSTLCYFVPFVFNYLACNESVKFCVKLS